MYDAGYRLKHVQQSFSNSENFIINVLVVNSLASISGIQSSSEESTEHYEDVNLHRNFSRLNVHFADP